MKTFVVLGMHRSATSLVAKGLNSCIFMGDNLLAGGVYNPFGNCEEHKFIKINDKILETAKGSWDNPPSEEAILDSGKQCANEIKDLIDLMNTKAIERLSKIKKSPIISDKVKELHTEPLWGWKDPRTTLTIKAYMPYLIKPHFVCCFRNPVEVAESLQKRNNWTLQQGLDLAKIYNQRLINFLTEVQLY